MTVRLESAAWQVRLSSTPSMVDTVQWKVSFRPRSVSTVHRSELDWLLFRLPVMTAILSVAAWSLRVLG